MSMKNSINNIGNRTRDLPSCIAVPERTAPPHAPRVSLNSEIKLIAHLCARRLSLWRVRDGNLEI